MDNYLMHYGVSVLDGADIGSGRYPLGSGEHAWQRGQDYYTSFNRLKNQGKTDKEIAEELGVFNKYKKPDATRARQLYSIAKDEMRVARNARMMELLNEGKSQSEVARIMGVGESNIRSWIKQEEEKRMSLTKETANVLKDYIDRYSYVDVGSGVEAVLGVNKSRLDTALTYLETQGYTIHTLRMDQSGDNKRTFTVIVPPGVSYGDLYEHRFDIRFPDQEHVLKGVNGDITSIGKLEHPNCVDHSRVYIRYAEDGGLDKDGMIELRRGVDDISLGNTMYAQVRVNVDDSHYLKGMARYADDSDIPPGYDIVFNTNKKRGTDFYDVIKPMERNEKTGAIDWSNPFGSTVSQRTYIGEDGQPHLSSLNIVREMGEWKTKWKDSLASQFLSKQPLNLAKRQLNLDADNRRKEFEEIKNLTNPTVKKLLLEAFAEKCDSAAEELKAAPFPGQQWHVLMPGPELKDDEIYAPNYADGTYVALIRYPHAGTFEIPILQVRNTGSPQAKYLKGAPDAVAINKKNHNRLSGADDDGDAVVVIPLSDKVKIRSTPELTLLKGFDPSEAYPGYEGMPVISEQRKNTEMGKTTNLLMDMSLQGANPEKKLAYVARHSMVIIDSKKHKLNWKQSEKDNYIADLKKEWQDNGDGHTGASTIITRAGSPTNIPQEKDWFYSKSSIGPNGEKITKPTNETTTSVNIKAVLKDGTKVKLTTEGKTDRQYYYETDEKGKRKKVYVEPEDLSRPQEKVFLNKDKSGNQYYVRTDESTGKKVREYLTEDDFASEPKTVLRTTETTKMAAAKTPEDVYALTSGGSKENPGHPMEKVYAEYAISMKSLANEARKEWVETEPIKKMSRKEANEKYGDEIRSLEGKYQQATAYSPIDRQAVIQANRVMAIMKEDNPNMTREEEKKYRGRKIQAARDYFTDGKGKPRVEISDKEWEAIQAGAISDSKLRAILDNANLDEVRQRATPRAVAAISPTMKETAIRMAKRGCEPNQIVSTLGISSSSVYSILQEAGVNLNDR